MQTVSAAAGHAVIRGFFGGRWGVSERGAAAVLDLVLANIRATSVSHAAAWRYSSLTGSGSPVELSFASNRRELRYTTEVAGPEIDPRRRVDEAARLLGHLGVPVDDGILARVRALQRKGELRYGCWLGGRHGTEGDAFKLYAEVPSDMASGRAADLLSTDARLLPRIVAFEVFGAGSEVYYRVRRMETWSASILPERLWPVFATMEELLESLALRPADRLLHGRNWGCSISRSRDGGAVAATLFTFGRRLIGGDRLIRERVLRVTSERGWTMHRYPEATAHLTDRRGYRTAHGLVAVGGSVDGAAHLGLGVDTRRGDP